MWGAALLPKMEGVVSALALKAVAGGGRGGGRATITTTVPAMASTGPWKRCERGTLVTQEHKNPRGLTETGTTMASSSSNTEDCRTNKGGGSSGLSSRRGGDSTASGSNRGNRVGGGSGLGLGSTSPSGFVHPPTPLLFASSSTPSSVAGLAAAASRVGHRT